MENCIPETTYYIRLYEKNLNHQGIFYIGSLKYNIRSCFWELCLFWLQRKVCLPSNTPKRLMLATTNYKFILIHCEMFIRFAVITTALSVIANFNSYYIGIQDIWSILSQYDKMSNVLRGLNILSLCEYK